jgi:hypothetical protein
MKLIILTAFWQRPAISRLYWLGIARLRRMAAFQVVAVCSPNDTANRNQAADAGSELVVVPNVPVAHKHNMGLARARELRADYVLRLDSDDLIGSGTFRWYLEAMALGVPYAGVLDCYFMDSATGKTVYWPGYASADPRAGKSIGTGRLVARELLERVGWKLWRGRRGKNRGMDGTMDERLRYVRPETLALRGSGRLLLDVKSRVNMWSMDQVGGSPIDASELLRGELSIEELDYTAALRRTEAVAS